MTTDNQSKGITKPIYFECWTLDTMHKAVLAALSARYSLDEKAGVLTTDEGTARCIEFLLNDGESSLLICDYYKDANAYGWTKANLDAVMDHLREFASETDYANEIDVIYHFNFNNLNRYDWQKGFAPQYTVSEIARALYVEDDNLHIELFETLAEYALEETAHHFDDCILTAEEAAKRIAEAKANA